MRIRKGFKSKDLKPFLISVPRSGELSNQFKEELKLIYNLKSLIHKNR